jgi:hypothetical protein
VRRRSNLSVECWALNVSVFNPQSSIFYPLTPIPPFQFFAVYGCLTSCAFNS